MGTEFQFLMKTVASKQHYKRSDNDPSPLKAYNNSFSSQVPFSCSVVLLKSLPLIMLLVAFP